MGENSVKIFKSRGAYPPPPLNPLPRSRRHCSNSQYVNMYCIASQLIRVPIRHFGNSDGSLLIRNKTKPIQSIIYYLNLL
jgi:hypothetical protein